MDGSCSPIRLRAPLRKGLGLLHQTMHLLRAGTLPLPLDCELPKGGGCVSSTILGPSKSRTCVSPIRLGSSQRQAQGLSHQAGSCLRTAVSLKSLSVSAHALPFPHPTPVTGSLACSSSGPGWVLHGTRLQPKQKLPTGRKATVHPRH